MTNIFRKPVKEEGSTKSIAFVHHKGGTGKTTSCLNVAGWLTKMGKQVLVVDLDPQGNATAGLGIDRTSLDSSIYDVFFGQVRFVMKIAGPLLLNLLRIKRLAR